MIDWGAFKRARGYLSAQRWRVVGVGACAVVVSLCFVALVLLLGLLGELLFTPDHSLQSLVSNVRWSRWYGPAIAWAYQNVSALQEPRRCLTALFGAAVVVAAVRAGCQYLQARWAIGAVVDVAHRLRRAIYRQA